MPARSAAKSAAPASDPAATLKAVAKTVAPLARFAIAPENPRTIRRPEDVDTLAATMRAEGQLQPVICYQDGKLDLITAGGTRFLAAQKAGLAALWFERRPKDEAIRAGLIEQDSHTPLHPADQAQAYAAELARLNGEGPLTREAAIKTIANRAGRTPRFVEQRLALAALHPPILKALRENKLTLPLAAAWANAPAERQAKAWASNHQLRDARAIRQALARGRLAGNDGLVKFVGLKTYREAGGELVEDLFTFGGDYGRAAEELDDAGKAAVFIADSGLVNRLAREKLQRAAKHREKEGWGFVEFGLSDYPAAKFERVATDPKTKEARGKIGLWLSVDKYEQKVRATPVRRKAEPKAGAKAPPASRNQNSDDYAASEKRRKAHRRITSAASTLVGRAVADATPGLALAIIAAQMARDVFELGEGEHLVGIDVGSDPDPVGLASDGDFKAAHKRWKDKLKPHADALEAYLLTMDGIDGLLAHMVGCCIFLSEWNPNAPDVEERAQLLNLARLAGVSATNLADNRTPKAADVLDTPLLRELLGLPAPPAADAPKTAPKKSSAKAKK